MLLFTSLFMVFRGDKTRTATSLSTPIVEVEFNLLSKLIQSFHVRKGGKHFDCFLNSMFDCRATGRNLLEKSLEFDCKSASKRIPAIGGTTSAENENFGLLFHKCRRSSLQIPPPPQGFLPGQTQRRADGKSNFALRHPAAHPLRRQLNHKYRHGQAGRFSVEENPRGISHDLIVLLSCGF